jgi:hypothetical protein
LLLVQIPQFRLIHVDGCPALGQLVLELHDLCTIWV